MYLLDQEWRFTYLNRKAREEIANGRDLVGRVLWEEFPQTKGNVFEENYRRAIGERVNATFETYFPPLSAWYEVQVVPLSGGGIGVWFRNINERKQSEAALTAANERHKLVVSAATDLVFDWNIATDEISWTNAIGSELGYSDEPKTREWFLSRIHPDDRDQVLSEITKCINNGSLFFCEARFLKADGQYIDLQHRGIFQRDQSGQAVRMICASQDVTEQSLARHALRQREAQLANIFGQALVGIMACTSGGRPTLVNSRFCEILGRSAEELLNCNVSEYTHPDDLAWNLPLLEEKVEHGTPFQIEKRYIRPDGSVVWCIVNVSFTRGPEGQIESAIIVAEDISDKKQAEIALKASEMLYRSVLEASADCIKILDLDGRLQLMNAPGLCAMEINDFETVRNRIWTDLWPGESKMLVAAALEEALAGKAARFTALCPTALGTHKWWDVVVSPMLDDEGNISKLLSISRDITLQRSVAAEVKWASEHDSLTGLANRRTFEARLRAATLRAMQTQTQVGLLLLDLDHFKHVNDTLGHAAGDHLLKVIGQKLQASLRQGDFVARLGGDEFAVIIEGGGGKLDLPRSGESILSSLNQPVKYEGRVMSSGTSIGGAIFPDDASSAHELFNNADTALYALKVSGRGGTRMFHQHMRHEAQLVSSQLSLARTALCKATVEPYYQQQIDLSTGRIAGFEALLRWRHSSRGIQQPDTIAEAFKDYELASKIGDLMQRRVFSDVRCWLNSDLPIGFVAINAAPVEFLRDDFAEKILARMKEHDIPPQLIEVEVTEHVFLERGSVYVGRALQELSAAGVRIALDDFGTGYSSLSHLRDYPVDVVKIDRSFIEKITTDVEVRAIVCAVIDLAKSLGIEIVAEGIEIDTQKNLLMAQGCGLGQGYLFGRAIDATEVPGLFNLRAHAPGGSLGQGRNAMRA